MLTLNPSCFRIGNTPCYFLSGVCLHGITPPDDVVAASYFWRHVLCWWTSGAHGWHLLLAGARCHLWPGERIHKTSRKNLSTFPFSPGPDAPCRILYFVCWHEHGMRGFCRRCRSVFVKDAVTREYLLVPLKKITWQRQSLSQLYCYCNGGWCTWSFMAIIINEVGYRLTLIWQPHFLDVVIYPERRIPIFFSWLSGELPTCSTWKLLLKNQ